ncbi:MAG: type II toxin-antitoxin system VapC family toxin [bacterium]
MIYYCDSSAVSKVYLDEAGSIFMRNIRRNSPRDDLFINDIAGPEVFSALHRRFRNGDLTQEVFSEARKDFRRDYMEFFHRVSLADSIIALAMELIEKHPLRGYDSVQLSSALNLQFTLRAFNGQEVHFVGSDKVLNNAAKNEGLTVINPSEQQ